MTWTFHFLRPWWLAAWLPAALLVWRLMRAQVLRDQARWLAALAVLQLMTGLSNVVLGWPLVAAVLHTAGAAALVVVLTGAMVASRRASVDATVVRATARHVISRRVST